MVNLNQNKVIYNNLNNLRFIKKNKLMFYYFYKVKKKYHFPSYIEYSIFNAYYLSHIYKTNLFEKNINAVYLLPKNLMKRVLFKTRHKHYKRFNIKYFNEVVYMFLISVWLKNIKSICKFIKNKLDNVHFKRHRRYILFFFKIIKRFVVPNFKTLQVCGLTMEFRGKVGRGGNSRKRVVFLRKGYYSLSNKMLCLQKNSWDVWTKTGSVGCSFQLFYNNYD